MKKLFTTLALLSFFAVPFQAASAQMWSYEGPNSLNPFTGFRQCNKCMKVVKTCNVNPCKCKVKCKRQKLTKCEKLHGIKYVRGKECGCAAPIIMPQPQCNNCQRAF